VEAIVVVVMRYGEKRGAEEMKLILMERMRTR
jgi:hypothetical protein